MMIITILILLVGFALLVFGANKFVDGSAALAKNYKVSGLIIGLTIVACGTSAPELAVSVTAAVEHSSEIALSNIIGSNMFNMLGILGICAVMSPLVVEKGIIKRDFTVAAVSTLAVFVAIGGFSIISHFKSTGQVVTENVATISGLGGAGLLLSYILYVAWIFMKEKNSALEDMSSVRIYSNKQCAVFIITGLIMIIAGGKLVVYSAKTLALQAGMSETLVGLTIVAIGTSLPELVTSIIATRKGQLGIALGNVLGSNIFNLLFILGVSAIISPVAVNVASVYDILILLVITIISWGYAFTERKITRKEGLIMIFMYVMTVGYAAMRI